MKTGAILAALCSAVLPLYLQAQVIVPAQDDPPTPPPPPPAAAAPATPAAPLPAPAIKTIQDAVDPSSAIDAYAKASAADRENIAVQEAYVRKMVSFGLPEMAETQAQEITRRDPENGLAWGVVAYMNAKRNQTSAALTAITEAARRAPDDPFILRTAAELVAWMDTRADKSQIPVSVEKAVNLMRTDLAVKQGYKDAYARAKDNYARAKQDQAAIARDTQPVQPEGTPPPTADSTQPVPTPPDTVQPIPPEGEYAVPQPPIVGDYGGYYYGPTVYTDPFAYGAYPAYGVYPAYWYPSAYYGNWWWPSFSLSFWYGGGWRHHGFYDRNWRHDRDWRSDNRGGRGGVVNRPSNRNVSGGHDRPATAARRGEISPTNRRTYVPGRDTVARRDAGRSSDPRYRPSLDSRTASRSPAPSSTRIGPRYSPSMSSQPRYSPSISAQPRSGSSYMASPRTGQSFASPSRGDSGSRSYSGSSSRSYSGGGGGGGGGGHSGGGGGGGGSGHSGGGGGGHGGGGRR